MIFVIGALIKCGFLLCRIRIYFVNVQNYCYKKELKRIKFLRTYSLKSLALCDLFRCFAFHCRSQIYTNFLTNVISSYNHFIKSDLSRRYCPNDMRDRNACRFSYCCRLAGMEHDPPERPAHTKALLLLQLWQRLYAKKQSLQPSEIPMRKITAFPVSLLRL